MDFRKISKDKYIIAGVITALIFVLGLVLGLLLEGYRNGWIETVNKDQENSFMSLQLQYLYLNSLENGKTSCPVLHTTLEKALNDLSNSLSDFLEYEDDSKMDKEDFYLSGRRYLLDNIRYWFFAQQAKKRCELEVLPILYFYSEDCGTCPNQGTILTYYRNLFGNKVLVFPMNMNFRDKEPMLDILASDYGVEEFPTLIIDNRKYAGLVDKEQLGKIICASLPHDENCKQAIAGDRDN